MYYKRTLDNKEAFTQSGMPRVHGRKIRLAKALGYSEYNMNNCFFLVSGLFTESVPSTNQYIKTYALSLN